MTDRPIDRPAFLFVHVCMYFVVSAGDISYIHTYIQSGEAEALDKDKGGKQRGESDSGMGFVAGDEEVDQWINGSI